METAVSLDVPLVADVGGRQLDGREAVRLMQPAPQKQEMVYRRKPPTASSPKERRGFAPAITPLIIGFLLLLGLILALITKRQRWKI